MSDAHHEHESAIRTPKQLAAAVAGFFLVTVLGIILLVKFVTTDRQESAGTNSQGKEAIAARLRPVADEGYVLKDANAPKVLLAGDAVYTANCVSCHGAGMAGAPKVGDAAAWGARIAQGYEKLVQHAIQGIRAMPPKGGNLDLDDIEVARAVVFMSNQSGAKFKEPAVPAPGVAAPAAADANTPAAAPVAVSGAPSGAPIAAPGPTPAATPATASAPASLPAAMPVALSADAGKNIYNAACVACHGPGIAGAPKVGDKAAWAPRIKQGDAVLYEHAIKGFQGKAGIMPPKGGSSASDAEVKAAVDFMVAAVK